MYEVADEILVLSHGAIVGKINVDEVQSAIDLTHRVAALESGARVQDAA
jgi:ribose transport system ATP-binding protein